jgi:hypothetical protein
LPPQIISIKASVDVTCPGRLASAASSVRSRLLGIPTGSVEQLHWTEHEKLPKAVAAVEDRGSGYGPSSLSGP